MTRGQGEESIRQRTRRDGSQFWEARVTLNGRQTSFYAATKTEALKRARAARADTERGFGMDATSVTIERHMLDWLELVRPTVRDSTFQSYSGHVHVWIVPHLGRVKVTDLTPAHVRKMLAAVAEAGRSDATVVRVRATLSSAMRQAQVDCGLTRNVASIAKPPKSPAPAFRREVLTSSDARTILAAFDSSRLWSLVAFAIGTGLRQGERLALHWSEIDLDRRLLHVRRSLDGKPLVQPKSKKSARTLPCRHLPCRHLMPSASRTTPTECLPAATGRSRTWCSRTLPAASGPGRR